MGLGLWVRWGFWLIGFFGGRWACGFWVALRPWVLVGFGVGVIQVLVVLLCWGEFWVGLRSLGFLIAWIC